jgi:hypothetical protein
LGNRPRGGAADGAGLALEVGARALEVRHVRALQEGPWTPTDCLHAQGKTEEGMLSKYSCTLKFLGLFGQNKIGVFAYFFVQNQQPES